MGAQPRNILAGVLTEGMFMAAIGVVAGVLVGFVAVRVVGRYIGEVHQLGALAYLASALTILAAVVIASAVPAARAARVNAVEALRTE